MSGDDVPRRHERDEQWNLRPCAPGGAWSAAGCEQVRSWPGLETKNSVELPAFEVAFQGGTLGGDHLASNQASYADLHVRIGLVVGLYAVLCDVGRLPQVAEVECREHSVALDAGKCVAAECHPCS